MTVAASALLLAALGLAGCGDDDGDGGGTSATQVAPTASSTTTSGDTVDTGGGDDGTTTAPSEPTGDPEVAGVRAGQGDEPIAMLPRPGDAGHVYLAGRGGTIVRMRVTAEGLEQVGGTLLDISGDTQAEGERGLLGMAFSEDGSAVYVSYTNDDGDTRLDAFEMEGDGIDAGSRETILEQDQPFANHNGGNVVLGPDGKLWFGFGDGGAGDDPQNNAQDPDTLLGKVVRLTPGEDPEIVVSGVRNPWRFSFDTDGSLWIADVGQNRWEEIDRLEADRIDGANLGWSGYEGTHGHLDGHGRRPDDAIAPIFEYPNGDEAGNCSITGGFVYRGEAIPALVGAYLFADYCAGSVRAITIDDQGRFARELDLDVEVTSPMSFGTDDAGEPYVLSQTGAITKLVPA